MNSTHQVKMREPLVKGDRVRIIRSGPAHPDYIGTEGTVVASYEQQYGCGSYPENAHTWTLNIDGHGRISWFHEDDLEIISQATV